MTGFAALVFLLTGFQLALLFANEILDHKDDPMAGQGRADAPQDYRDFAPIPVNINRADSLTLLEIPGIGPYYASRILRYRKRLGAFAVKEQLMEIRGIDYDKFRRMEPEIEILPEDVKAPDIWSLPADSLRYHPYLDSHSARAIVIFRENHPESSWKIDSLLKEGVINERSARGLKLYFE